MERGCGGGDGGVILDVSGDKPGAAPHNPLVGNLDELRKQVDSKFEIFDAVPKPKAVPKPEAVPKRRISHKRADTTNMYGAHTGTGAGIGYSFEAVGKKPAAAGAAAGGWTVLKFTRKSGPSAGKDYYVYVAPDGVKYTSCKKAQLAGYVPH